MKLTHEVTLTPAQLAEAFCDLDDEKQAQFFVDVAKIASTWECQNMPQWLAVGRHLRTCQCSTDEARKLVRDLAYGAGMLAT